VATIQATTAPLSSEVNLTGLVQLASVHPSSDLHPVIAPFTGETAAWIRHADEVQVEQAAKQARAAQRLWERRPVKERCAIILRFHDLVLQHRHRGMDIIQLETGKARKDALEEILDVAITARHYGRDAARLLRTKHHRGALPFLVGVEERHVPRGVVGVIAPWNYPLSLAVSDAIPALLAGNAVIVKPDVQTTLTALWGLQLLHEAGLPKDLLQVVPGEGPEVGPMVVDRVDYVMFTGSTRVGREVAARAGQRLIGCSLELGGKNAMIIRADAEIHKAAEIAARACFSNAGQLCISMERMYVNERIADQFVPAFIERVQGMRMAPRIGWGADMGSLISAKQRDRVIEHIADAQAKGARVLAGGAARPDIGPFYVEPTILTDVNDKMLVCDEETFGPVVSISTVRDDEEAIAKANDTDYGLNAAVVTRSTRAGVLVARQLRAGTVNVNEGYAAAWGSIRAPMGGMGDSGLGRRHGDEGLLKYTEPQTIASQRALGFGAQFGWSDERWGETLVSAMGAMKRLGLK